MYAIHCPPLAGDSESAAEAMKATRIGFCYSGFVFGPFWLAAHRLWRPLLIYVVGAALIGFLIASGMLAASVAWALELAVRVLIGLEGRAWLGAAWARSGLPLVDIVAAPDADEAARIYFSRALANPAAPPAAIRVAPPSAREIIGSFPEAQRQ